MIFIAMPVIRNVCKMFYTTVLNVLHNDAGPFAMNNFLHKLNKDFGEKVEEKNCTDIVKTDECKYINKY